MLRGRMRIPAGGSGAGCFFFRLPLRFLPLFFFGGGGGGSTRTPNPWECGARGGGRSEQGRSE